MIHQFITVRFGSNKMNIYCRQKGRYLTQLRNIGVDSLRERYNEKRKFWNIESANLTKLCVDSLREKYKENIKNRKR